MTTISRRSKTKEKAPDDDGTIRVSKFQSRVLKTPESCDLFLGGGRGGSKSFTMLLVALRHIEQHQQNARILYLRKTYRGISDFEELSRDLFGKLFGKDARYNAQAHTWRFANGAIMELGQLEASGDYGKFQGHSYSLLLVDEGGQYAQPDLLDKIRSNLRGPANVPIRMIMAANPGDAGHHWIARRYVFRAKPWIPFLEDNSKRKWIYCPSVFTDNPFINQPEYRQQLESSAPSDPELLRAWLEGDWAIARGAFFAAVLDEKRNAIDPWQSLMTPDESYRRTGLSPAKAAHFYNSNWEVYLAHDYGTSAPSVTYVCAKSPGTTGPDERWYPRGSILLLDELATYTPGDLNKGLNWTIPALAEEIKKLCKRWGIKPEGVADDSCFAKHGHGSGSISDEFASEGVKFTPARKGDRRSGWERMRRMLEDAGKPDRPGLYISRHCEYFWSTVPYLARDPRRMDDLASDGPDHGADCARYALLRDKRVLRQTRLGGL